jgi:hypothetical protein
MNGAIHGQRNLLVSKTPASNCGERTVRYAMRQLLRWLSLAATAGISSGYQAKATEELRHWDADSFGEPLGPVTVSADGRFIAYVGRNNESPYRISNGPNGVFLWDRNKPGDLSAASADPIQLIQDPSGKYVFQTEQDYYRIGMSADGKRMALECSPPEGGLHIALVDLDLTGIAGPTVSAVSLASVLPNGRPLDGICRYPSMSADGRFVVFACNAQDFALPGEEPFAQVFLYDSKRQAAEKRENVGVELISQGPSGAIGNGDSGWLAFFEGAVISSNGRWAAFLSEASNLIRGDTDEGGFDLFVADLESTRAGGPTPAFELVRAPRVVDDLHQQAAVQAPVCVSPSGEYVACEVKGMFGRSNRTVAVVYQVVREEPGGLAMRLVGKPIGGHSVQLSDSCAIAKTGKGIEAIRLGIDQSILIPVSGILSWLSPSGSQLYWLSLNAGTSVMRTNL